MQYPSYTAEEAAKFAASEGVNGIIPINTGKHVYCNWTHIMNKVGALNPLVDPFKMEANKDIVPDYRADMCPETLDLLSRSVYIPMRPEWTAEEIEGRSSAIKKLWHNTKQSISLFTNSTDRGKIERDNNWLRSDVKDTRSP